MMLRLSGYLGVHESNCSKSVKLHSQQVNFSSKVVSVCLAKYSNLSKLMQGLDIPIFKQNLLFTRTSDSVKLRIRT